MDIDQVIKNIERLQILNQLQQLDQEMKDQMWRLNRIERGRWFASQKHLAAGYQAMIKSGRRCFPGTKSIVF